MRCTLCVATLVAGLSGLATAQDLTVGDVVVLVERDIHIPAHPAPSDNSVAFRFASGSVADILAIDAASGWLEIRGERVGGAEATGWIIEKYRAWGDTHGDIESVFSKDELLTNIMVYWVTGTINSSTRLYYEMRKSGRAGFTQGRVEVPTGCASFPKELYNAPREWAERHYNVTHYETFEKGGHFAALEQPATLAGDMRTFFRTVR